MSSITEAQAVDAYQFIHDLNNRKLNMTKMQKEAKELVKLYLSDNPGGFFAELENRREKVHVYHVTAKSVDRTTVDKEYLRTKIKDAMADQVGAYHIPSNLTTSYLARMVEEGFLDSADIESAEDTTSSTPVKKKKATGEQAQAFRNSKMVPAGVSEMTHGTAGAAMTVSRGDGTVEIHRPQVTRFDKEGNGTVMQEASVERVEPGDKEQEPGGRWAV